MKFLLIRKQLIFVYLFLFSFGMLQAQDAKPIVKSDKTEIVNGKKYYLHTIEKGHTLYSISKIYQVDLKVLEADTNNLHLKIGQIIRIPSNEVVKEAVIATQKPDSNFKTHTIASKETLYGIAHKYNVEEEDILKLNPELKDGLKPGQIIKIQLKKQTEIKKEKVKQVEQQQLELPKENIEVEKPKIQEAVTAKLNKKKSYNIALLIPLYLKNMGEIIPENVVLNKQTAADFKSFTFIQFYEGFMQVVDTMAKQGLNLKVFTYDMPDDTALTASFLKKNDLSKMDLIVGPFFYKTFKIVAEYAKNEKIPIINPFSERRNILENNPYAFKLTPAYDNQVDNIVKYLADSFPTANILLIHNAKELEKKHAECFKTAINTIFKEKSVKENPAKEIIYSQAGFAGLQAKLSAEKENMIITLIESELFVTGYISKLNSIKDRKITLIAPIQWKNFDKIETEYFIKLNTHFYEPNFVDYNEVDTKAFIKRFREKYLTEPNEMAFAGYDVALFFLSALSNFGTDFQQYLPNIKAHTLQTNFVFKRAGENNGFENTFVNIYKMQDFKYVGVNK
ncbi:MAG: LysM peptidoglycan-binding domain-containing protein [Bacteroidetes bacterium]|nr:LysM peptidoglycan-binding domain-containing protein [Bacteroidota bacterium]